MQKEPRRLTSEDLLGVLVELCEAIIVFVLVPSVKLKSNDPGLGPAVLGSTGEKEVVCDASNFGLLLVFW